MKTIMVGKEKGGCGATTTVRELAVAAAASGQKVVLIDLDAHHGLSKWWNRRTEGLEGTPNPALAAITPHNLADGLAQLAAAGVDLAIIDVPPAEHPFISSLMRLANLILVPVVPTTDDLDTLPTVLAQIQASGRPYAFVLTRGDERTNLFKDTEAALKRKAPIAGALSNRSAFPAAAGFGEAAVERKGRAQDEVLALWKWVRNALKKAS